MDVFETPKYLRLTKPGPPEDTTRKAEVHTSIAKLQRALCPCVLDEQRLQGNGVEAAHAASIGIRVSQEEMATVICTRCKLEEHVDVHDLRLTTLHTSTAIC
jgi:hypothetical protein